MVVVSDGGSVLGGTERTVTARAAAPAPVLGENELGMVMGKREGDDRGGAGGQGQGTALLFGGVVAGDGLEGDGG